MKEKKEIRKIEVQLLLEAIYLKYGYDFRMYTKTHMKRRIEHALAKFRLASLSEMIHRVLHDEDFFGALFLDLTVNVTEMFRDPFFYQTLRDTVIPELRKIPFIKVWHAGCATGEEVYSFAIVLKEEGLYDRVQIYATDLNEVVLQKAKKGIFPINTIREYTANYQKSGGKFSFADYYTAKYDSVILDKSLKERVLFSDHNLVTDGVFGEMNIIICRNVLIYFSKPLQRRVVRLFSNSLAHGGFLCLGTKESIRFTGHDEDYEVVANREKIYRKR